jgi:hypothetical protein
MSTPPTPRQIRLKALRDARKLIDAEIAELEAAGFIASARKRRGATQPCGTEERYQQHHHYKDTATDKRRVTCQPCLEAHAAHERAKAAVRRAQTRQWDEAS